MRLQTIAVAAAVLCTPLTMLTRPASAAAELARLVGSDANWGYTVDGDSANERVIVGGSWFADVMIFRRAAGVWGLEHHFVNNTQGWGVDVGIDGDWAIVGSSSTRSDGTAGQQLVFMHHFDGTAWSQVQVLADSNYYNSGYGTSVAVSGNRAVVADPNLQLLAGNNGKLYAYAFDGTTWSLEEALYPPSNIYSWRLGWSLAMTDDLIVAGMPAWGTSGARLFRHDGTSWTLETDLFPAAGGLEWGSHVATDGEFVAIGNAFASVTIFRNVAGTWTEIQTLPPTTAQSFSLSRRLSLANGVLVVGGSGSTENNLRVYRFDGSQFVLHETIVGTPGQSQNLGGAVWTDGDIVVGADAGYPSLQGTLMIYGPSGACCHPDDTCTDEASVEACETAGGVFQGIGTSCDDTGCSSGFFIDPVAFEAAIAQAGLTRRASEDFGEAVIPSPPGFVVMDDPLDASTNNGVFVPGDIVADLVFQSNIDGRGLAGPNPRGAGGLVASLPVPPPTPAARAVSTATAGDGIDVLSVLPVPPPTAVSMRILGDPGALLHVTLYDLDGLVISQTLAAAGSFVGAMPAAPSAFQGPGTPPSIGRVNVWDPDGGTAGLAEISFYGTSPRLDLLVQGGDPGALSPGDQVTVELSMLDLSSTGSVASGFQAFLAFDSTHLSFVSGAYTAAPFGLPIVSPIAASPDEFDVINQIDLAAIIDVGGGQTPSSADAVLATLTFEVVGDIEACDVATAVRFRTAALPSRVIDAFGLEIAGVALEDLDALHVDGLAPLLTAPSDVATNADAGGCDAALDPGLAFAVDGCDPAPAVTWVRSDGKSSLTDAYDSADSPITITWTATDASGNASQAVQTVTVHAFNDFTAGVEFFGSFATTFDRCIEFDLYPTGCGSPITVSQVLTFVNGSAIATFDVPCGDYACVTARDPLHSLSRTDGEFAIVGTQYACDFTSGGASYDALLLGNLNGDGYVDILDFGTFIVAYGTNYGSGDTDCLTSAPHADVSGDGLVNLTDFSFLAANFFESGEGPCCGMFAGEADGAAWNDLGGSGPMSRISTAELRAHRRGELARADLNHDGWVDAQDVALFAQRGHP